jgi:hypothetical protein
MLKTDQDRIISLANQLQRRKDLMGVFLSFSDQLVNLEISAKSAEANFENAKLTREVAAVAIVEYEEGEFIQDKETLEGERLLAQSDRDRQRDRVDLAKAMLSDAEKANDPQLSDILKSEEIELSRCDQLLADNDSKLKVLEEYTKPKRLKELRAQVEKARADELDKRVECELRQSHVKQIQESIKAYRLPADQRRAREELDRRMRDSRDRAISIAEQLQTKLDQLTANSKPGDPAPVEIRDLLNQLGGVLDQAEAEQYAAQLDELKLRIHKAAN